MKKWICLHILQALKSYYRTTVNNCMSINLMTDKMNKFLGKIAYDILK